MDSLLEARRIFSHTICTKMEEKNIRDLDIRMFMDLKASSTIFNWKRGKSLPHMLQMYKLSMYFDMPVYEFFGQGPIEDDPLPIVENIDFLDRAIKMRIFLLAKLNSEVKGFAVVCQNMMQHIYQDSLPTMNSIIEICCKFDIPINVLLPGRCNLNIEEKEI